MLKTWGYLKKKNLSQRYFDPLNWEVGNTALQEEYFLDHQHGSSESADTQKLTSKQSYQKAFPTRLIGWYCTIISWTERLGIQDTWI